MNAEMQTSLLNMYPPILNSFFNMIKSWKMEEDSGTTSMVGIYPKIFCWPRDVKKLIGYIPKMSNCSNARVQRCGHEAVGLNLGGHR